jgi:tetratricopeptide (TPR) repeat protein
MNISLHLPHATLLGLLGVGLLILGSQGPWLDFPLTAALYAKDFTSPWADLGLVSLSSVLTGISVFAGISWLLGLRGLSLFAGLTAVLVMIIFFHSWLLSETWLPRFIHESEQREALQGFLTHYYWPNLNPEPTTTLEKDFEYLLDQLRVFWSATGWGWGFFSLGVVLIMLDNLFLSPLWRLGSLAILCTAVIFVVVLLYPLLNAELEHRRGDTLLNSGQLSKAISAYQTALRLNPNLQTSNRFIVKASRAYYQLEGEDSLLGLLYRASARIRSGIGQPLSKPAKENLEKSSQILSRVLHTPYQGSALESAILQQARKDYMHSLREQGLDAYVEGDLSVSLSLLERAFADNRKELYTGFLLAHVQRELGLVADSIALLDEILELVEHDSTHADLLCTLGDAFIQAQQPWRAREAYRRCLENDTLFNFRAVRNLSGT